MPNDIVPALSEHLVEGPGPTRRAGTPGPITTAIVEGRQTLVRSDDTEIPVDALAQIEALAAKLRKYRTTESRWVEHRILTETDVGAWLQEHCPRGRPRNGRGGRPFLIADLGISKDQSAAYRKLAALGHDKVRYAVRQLRTNAKTKDREIGRETVLNFYRERETEITTAKVKRAGTERNPLPVSGSLTATVEVHITALDADTLRQAGESIRERLAEFEHETADLAFKIANVELHDEPVPDDLESVGS